MRLGKHAAGKELRVRYIALGAFFMVGLLILVISLYRLMVVRHDEFLALSQDNQWKDVRIRAPRGQIRDSRGQIVVEGRPSFNVYITPTFCLECIREVLPRLAEWLRWDNAHFEKISKQIQEATGLLRYQAMMVSGDLARNELDILNARLQELPGVEIEVVPQRHYRAKALLAHLTGYMNEVTRQELEDSRQKTRIERPVYAPGDFIGRTGIERAFEEELRGVDGWKKVVVNARGQVVRDDQNNIIERREAAPVPGNTVVLSLDLRLQAAVEQAFEKAEAGVAVVVDVKTGFLLALFSKPSFDPNLIVGRQSSRVLAELFNDPMQPMLLRATQQHYHPGSIFKPISLLAALRTEVMNEHTLVNCLGGYRLGSRTWRCHKDSGHGFVNAKSAMQKSCDTYFYRAADLMGIDAIAEEARLFGLGQPSRLGISSEAAGVMPDSAYHDSMTPGGYSKGMALNTAIGQGDVNTTPLQAAMLYAAIANKGTLFQPQLVRRVESLDGRVLKEFSPKIVHHIPMTEKEYRLMVDSLSAVVNETGGTAFRYRLSHIRVAGKTGTAQVARLGKKRLKKEEIPFFQRDHAWFAAFAAVDEPEIAVLVLNEHGGHGSSDAAPIAMKIIEKYFELKKLDETGLGSPEFPYKTDEVPPALPGNASQFAQNKFSELNKTHEGTH
ncbi:MAG: penicillin-binding protein 2 [Cystobacterineae bacterium]|nr:penicillin-binding protein 2 [Cystobacterineae bacterium]